MRFAARFLIVAAFAAAVAAPSRAAEVDNLLPKETEYVIQLNVKQMVESDIVKKLFLAQLKQTLEGKDAAKILKDLGLDPMKDIEKVTVGAWGKGQADMNGLIVVRGTFDAKKMMETAQTYAKESADKFSIIKEGEFELIKFTGDDGKDGFISVREGKPIIAGTDKKLVAASAEASDAKAKPVLSKELTALVLKQDAKASMFACGITEGKIGEIPGDLGQLKGLVDVDKLKAGITKSSTMGLTVNLGKEVTVAIKIGMKDDDSADDFAGELTKLVTAAKTFLPLIGGMQKQFKALIDDVTANLASSSKDKDVVVTVKLSAEAIGQASGTGEEKDK